MNSNIAIKVKNLTKIYHLYDKPQDRLKEALNPFKKSYHHDFYAMNDVSFEIKKGETVGIIGKNGAGKSTLLKMITGVLTPTSGSIEVHGKIASLLELGAGFNPEMTGLENIYLNGTLMGFTREAMESKIAAITKFADIGEFIHQPVKSYSSGMFARLAFSVAINVEPDILIVDEVLSVGDMRFQQKSLRKMKEMQKKGISILFVTHDMGVINTFCSRVIWVDKGSFVKAGDTETISKQYISFMSYGLTEVVNHNDEKDIEKQSKSQHIFDSEKYHWTIPADHEAFGEYGAKITGMLISDINSEPITNLFHRQQVHCYIRYETFKDLNSVGIGILLKDRLMNNIFTLNSYMFDKQIDFIKSGSVNIAKFTFEFPYLAEGTYTMSVAISEGIQEDHVQHHWIHDLYEINFLSRDKTNKVAAILAFDSSEVDISNEEVS
jgi:ABC-type polysaccharide/polyol phosphate transport system ATPase subunit